MGCYTTTPGLRSEDGVVCDGRVKSEAVLSTERGDEQTTTVAATHSQTSDLRSERTRFIASTSSKKTSQEIVLASIIRQEMHVWRRSRHVQCFDAAHSGLHQHARTRAVYRSPQPQPAPLLPAGASDTGIAVAIEPPLLQISTRLNRETPLCNPCSSPT